MAIERERDNKMGRGRGGNNGIIAISVNIQEFRIPFMKKHPILSYLLLFFFFRVIYSIYR